MFKIRPLGLPIINLSIGRPYYALDMDGQNTYFYTTLIL